MVGVQISALKPVSFSKIFHYNCFYSTRGYKWVPVSEEVDILFEKSLWGTMRSLGMYIHQGAE